MCIFVIGVIDSIEVVFKRAQQIYIKNVKARVSSFNICFNIRSILLNRDVEPEKRLNFASTTIQHFFYYPQCRVKLRPPSFNIVGYVRVN